MRIGKDEVKQIKKVFFGVLWPFIFLNSYGQSNSYINIDDARLIVEKKIVEIYGQSFLDSHVVYDEKRSYPFYVLNQIKWQGKKDQWNDAPKSYFVNGYPKLAECFVVAFDVSFDSSTICDNGIIVCVDSTGNIIRPHVNRGLGKERSVNPGCFKLSKQDYINVATKHGYNSKQADFWLAGGIFNLVLYPDEWNGRFAISVGYSIDIKGGFLNKTWFLDPWTGKLIRKKAKKILTRWYV